MMICAAMLACTGQLFWKLSAEFGIGCLMAGFALYGLGAVLMLFAYKYGSVSVLQPVLSINYAFSIILGWLVLKESISLYKVAGIIIITMGVILIAGGDK